MSDQIREQVLDMIREERLRQVRMYGDNDNLRLGFGSVRAHPWLEPYSDDTPAVTEARFRSDYLKFEDLHGSVTWMHLIREEVAELFAALTLENTIEEAIQVAALCTSMVETMLKKMGYGEQ